MYKAKNVPQELGGMIETCCYYMTEFDKSDVVKVDSEIAPGNTLCALMK